MSRSLVSNGKDEKLLGNVIEMLSLLDAPPESAEELNFLTSPATKGSKKPVVTPQSLRRRAEDAWLSVLRSSCLYIALRKSLLRIMSTKILPWMSRPETLMDFLTDSYDVGGSTSLLALSGLFHLITTKNLDYPSFYPKLYSLIDADLLQSKHRSRFLRLLPTFLDSTRLPATLVASFIKRLSRHALFGPPAGIVAIIPFIYNLLKAHPTCTFMIHRNPYPPYTKSTENLGADPFDMKQTDPQLTGAIDSSLWELETLQSHYHPNVASLARVISEQFTKQQYNIEDFLDHGYGNMMDSELAKEPKKEPVVEWKIPKRIFTRPNVGEEGEAEEESLITKLWDFSELRR
jgi:U3 small nucleolar RNA-associated protein 19